MMDCRVKPGNDVGGNRPVTRRPQFCIPSAMRHFPPRRIVCLTEETVETLYLLGEQDRIVGYQVYAVRPPQVRREKPSKVRSSSSQVGTASLASPYRLSSNCSALSDGSKLISQVRMPSARASDTNPAAGKPERDAPIATNRSAS